MNKDWMSVEVDNTGKVGVVPELVEEAVHDEEDEEENPHTLRELCGASVVMSIIGWLLGGPLCGVLGAGGAAIAVSSKSEAGEMARKGGEAVAKVSVDPIKSFEQDHHVVENTVEVVENLGSRIKSFDEDHHVVENAVKGVEKGLNWTADRVEPGMEWTSERAKKFEQNNHGSIEKAEIGLLKSFHWTADRVEPGLDWTINHAKRFEDNHHVVENTTKGIQKGYQNTVKRLKPRPSTTQSPVSASSE